MDLSGIVNYESTFEYEVVNPSSGEATGLVLELQSVSSPDVKVVTRRQLDFITDQQRKGKAIKIAVAEEKLVEKLAASVVSWEWGGSSNFKGEKLPFNTKNVVEVLNVDWIFEQVSKQVQDIENFTKN